MALAQLARDTRGPAAHTTGETATLASESAAIDDLELLRRIGRGDAAAYRAFADRYLDRTVRFATRVAEVPIRHAQAVERAGSSIFRHALSAAFAAALMVAFGVAAGAFSGGDAEDGSSVAEATSAEPAVEAGAEDDGWDDLTAIAFAEELGQEP